MTTRLRGTSLDEAFLNLDEVTVMSVQLEVRVAGRLDAERLAAALRTAVAAHPIARARLASGAATDTGVVWEIDEDCDHLAIEITDEPAADVRARLQSRVPDLTLSPGFSTSLVHEDDGDYLMLNLHHAAFDGMSAVRLLTSVARAYSGEDDPIGGPALAEARNLKALAGARGIGDVASRGLKIAQDAAGRTSLTRIAGDGGQPGPHYAFSTLRLTAEQAAAAISGKPKGTTVNDLAIAAHLMTVMAWNAEQGAAVGRTVSAMMPVNMRPAEWSGEVLSNFASYVAVVVDTGALGSLPEATSAVRDQTKPMKESGTAGWIVDVLDRGNALPNVLKRNLQKAMPLVERQFTESTVLSNLGRVQIPAFGAAGEVMEVWFSPPCMASTMPLAFGLAGVGRELHACLRADRSKISADGVARYAELLERTLTGPRT